MPPRKVVDDSADATVPGPAASAPDPNAVNMRTYFGIKGIAGDQQAGRVAFARVKYGVQEHIRKAVADWDTLFSSY